MSTYRTEATLEVPDGIEEPLEVAATVYDANGYRSQRCESGARTFERGRAEARWWTSDMTNVPAKVCVQLQGADLHVAYDIDTTGQYLTEADRDLWEGEIRALAAQLEQPDREPVDLRAHEARRGRAVHARMLRYGIWAAILAFVLVLVSSVWFGG